MRKKIKICGVSFKIREVEVIDEADEGVTCGQIIYSKAKILICKRIPQRLKKRILYHEILHGMLDQLGYTELSLNEEFVQAMSNAMYQMFKLR